MADHSQVRLWRQGMKWLSRLSHSRPSKQGCKREAKQSILWPSWNDSIAAHKIEVSQSSIDSGRKSSGMGSRGIKQICDGKKPQKSFTTSRLSPIFNPTDHCCFSLKDSLNTVKSSPKRLLARLRLRIRQMIFPRERQHKRHNLAPTHCKLFMAHTVLGKRVSIFRSWPSGRLCRTPQSVLGKTITLQLVDITRQSASSGSSKAYFSTNIRTLIG
jgi:hypothetical protein